MKKTIAILLLAVYVFNLCGYSLVFRYFIEQSDRQFVQQLDKNNYKESDLVEISIPLHLPYMLNSSGFERVEGAVENNGIHYNYVKRRICDDTLYIMCLPNNQKTELVKEKAHYSGEVNDFATGKKEKESTAKKVSFNAEYYNEIAGYSFTLPGTILSKPAYGLSISLSAAAIDRPAQPPKSAC